MAVFDYFIIEALFYNLGVQLMGSTRTENFKNVLQEEYSQILGVRISKERSWFLFKATIAALVQGVIDDEEHKLPFSGIGTFYLRFSPPRVPSGKPSAVVDALKASGQDRLPYFRWKISEGLKRHIISTICGKEVANAFATATPKFFSKTDKTEGGENEEPPSTKPKMIVPENKS